MNKPVRENHHRENKIQIYLIQWPSLTPTEKHVQDISAMVFMLKINLLT